MSWRGIPRKFRSGPPEGPGAHMGWNMHGAQVVNDRVVQNVGFFTVSLSVRLMSCFTGGSGTSDTRDQIQNSIYLLPGSPSYNFFIIIIIIIIIVIIIFIFACIYSLFFMPP